MKHNEKSPIKHTSKSLPFSNMSRSRSKVLPPSKSKQKPETRNKIYDSQAYRNVLSKLVSQNTIEGFLKLASLYVILNDEVVRPYLTSLCEVKNSQIQFLELGKALVRDGSFIKHYCKLLVLKEPSRQGELKQYFYDQYKQRLCEKTSYFQQYFKGQISVQKQQILSKSQKSSSKPGLTALSFQKKSNTEQKKNKSILKQSRFMSKDPDSYSAIDLGKDEALSERSVSCISQKSNFTPRPAKEAVQQNCEEQTSLPPFVYISERRKRKETEEERQKRLLGLADHSQSQPSGKFQMAIVSSNQLLQSNPSLKNTYESIKKQREQMRKKESPFKKQASSSQPSPIYRSSYKELMGEVSKKRIQALNPKFIEKFTPTQQRLLQSNFYPNLTKFGFKRYVDKEYSSSVGQFQDKTLKKCQMTDVLQFGEPTYVAVYLDEGKPSSKKATKDSDMKDETVSVILVEEFEKQLIFQTSTKRKVTFGKS